MPDRKGGCGRGGDVGRPYVVRVGDTGWTYPGTPYIASLGLLRARGRSVIAKPQNHPTVPGKGDALTIMLDEPKPLEFA